MFALKAVILATAGLAAADSYANFFNDKSCTDGKGNGVDMNNPGCLNEAGRGSVYLSDNLGQSYVLCSYSSSDCNDKIGAYDFTATGFCYQLGSAASYKFVGSDSDC